MYGGFALPFIATRWREVFCVRRAEARIDVQVAAWVVLAAGGPAWEYARPGYRPAPNGWPSGIPAGRDAQTQTADRLLDRLMSQIRALFVQVIFVRGCRSVGSHNVSCHGREIRGSKRTLITEPTARTMDGQRPSAINQPAKQQQLLAAQESIANGSPCLRILWQSHIAMKLHRPPWDLWQPPSWPVSPSPAGPI